jgi:two-component system chemotaxis response regulator CheY
MKKILVVDDSKAMRMIVRRTLRQAGFDGHDVQEAGDGAEALGVIDSWKPDLVLSDWNMPNMSGIDLLRTMRGKGDSRAFGFVTSEGTAEMRKLAADNGALFLIAKPFDEETFRSALTPVL